MRTRIGNVWGTDHFVTRNSAFRYYREQGFDDLAIERKFAEGEIKLGAPKINPHECVRLIDKGTRYAIVEVIDYDD